MLSHFLIIQRGRIFITEIEAYQEYIRHRRKAFCKAIIQYADIGKIIQLVGTFPIDVKVIFFVRVDKISGTAVVRRDSIAAAVVFETGLALNELFKDPVAAGSEVHRSSSLFCFRAKGKPARP